MSWEHSHLRDAVAVFLYDGCDELPDPDAIFHTEEDAQEFIARERVKAMLDDFEGDAKAAEAAGRTPDTYLPSASTQPIRNMYVPWWNSYEDVDSEPGPVPDEELTELVRLNAPQEGEDTLRAVERRLEEWHARKYGRKVNGPRTFAKLCEELGELAEAINEHGHRVETNPDAGKWIAKEAADMVIVLFHLIRGAGASLVDAINEKIPIIEQRLIDPNAGRDNPTSPQRGGGGRGRAEGQVSSTPRAGAMLPPFTTTTNAKGIDHGNKEDTAERGQRLLRRSEEGTRGARPGRAGQCQEERRHQRQGACRTGTRRPRSQPRPQHDIHPRR